ncbi:unnamed protein product [Ectocarpus sp. 4 AP-2014]
MRASATCLAAALIGGSLAPGGEGLVFRTQARARGGATAGRQRGSFCSGVECPAVGKSVDAFGRGGEMLMSAAAAGEQEAAAAGKLPWVDSTLPRELPDEISAENPLRVVIAGGGVGGLLTAKYLKMQGYDVKVIEKTNAFRRFGGPIQLASNALSTIKAIDPTFFEKVMEYFTFTGIRTNGIKDGIRTEWYCKFDAITQMADMYSLPYTGVIDRPDLQAVLMEDIGEGVVFNSHTVVGFENTDGFVGILYRIADDGGEVHADVLVGADGIWSQVRAQMWNEDVRGENGGATYSGYTVFAGETIYAPKDYWEVGYKVYIGPGQYFVTSDIGRGRMQWYSFLALPPGSKSREDNIKYLKDRFDGWSPEIHEALDCTSNNDVEQRDLYDRPPSLTKSWAQGNAVLIGDACHPMMPNLGQGGCQAMEDGYMLTNMLKDVTHRSQIPETLESFYRSRIIRTSAIQGLSRIASDLIVKNFDTPMKMTLSPFNMDAPGGVNSVMTSLMKPVLPFIFFAQFMYLYRCPPARCLSCLCGWCTTWCLCHHACSICLESPDMTLDSVGVYSCKCVP